MPIPLHRSRAVFLVLVLALLAPVLAGLVLPVSAASAAQVAGHAGHTAVDGRFLGSFLLDDGTVAYCIDQPARAPSGGSYSAPDSSTAIAAPDDQARLAYILRTWGASTDPSVAAAVALNVWRVTGLGGRSVDELASRAGQHRDHVLRLMDEQRREADAHASRTAQAGVRIQLDTPRGTGTVTATVTTETLAGTAELPPRAHEGVVQLEGAVFEDGTTRATVSNGVPVPIRLVSGPTAQVRADAEFTGLPLGAALGVLTPQDDGRQRLVAVSPELLSVRASADTGAVPGADGFQPEVRTRTSAAVAAAGSSLHDVLEVSAPVSETNPAGAWGVVRSEDGLVPLTVTVRSVLWGPFEQRPTEQSSPPEGSQRVCEVDTAVDGPGEYRTPECELPAAGYYVWTESIEGKAATPETSAVGPWAGRFGLADETTLVPWKPGITTTASHAQAEAGICAFDALHVTGVPGAARIPLTATLWGPFATAPAEGTTVDPASAPKAGEVAAEIEGSGTVRTPCITVTEAGHYVWTHSSGAAEGVEATESLVVAASETMEVRAPITRAALAETGVSAAAAPAALTIIGSGMVLALAGRWRRRRARRSSGTGEGRLRKGLDTEA